MHLKYLFIGLALLVCTTAQAQISFDIPAKEFKASVVGETVDFGKSELYGEPGEPELPVYRTTFLLPPNADIKTVVVHLEGLVEQEVAGKVDISPVLPDYTFDKQGNKIYSYYGSKRGTVYDADAFFPSKHLRLVQTGQLRGYKLVEVYIQRYRYNPIKKTLKELISGTVKIDYKNAKAPKLYSEPASAEKLVRKMAVNYSAMAPQYAPAKKDAKGAGYVVIAPSAIQSSSAVLSDFISAKRADDLDVTVLTEDDWGGGSGQSAADNIRGWLVSNYQSMGIEYVFIVGDASIGSAVPMVQGPHASTDIPLTDYVYSDLTGDSGGMEGFDKYAEVSVGRLPVYGGTSEVDAVMTKIIDYMKEDAASAESWRFKAYLPLHTFGDAQSGYPFGEEVNNRILSSAGWDVWRLYDTGIHMGEASGIDYSSVTSHWNEQQFSIMIWQAHGLVTLAQEVMTTEHSSGLTDDYPCHGFQISCHNGRPDDASNLGWAIVKNAGVSTVASAVQIWYNQNTVNYGTRGAGNDFAFVYAENLVKEMPSGPAMSDARAVLPITSPNDWQNLVELNLYGCPAVGPYTYGVTGGGDSDTDTDSDADTDADSDTDSDTDTDTGDDDDDDNDNNNNDDDNNDDNNNNDDNDDNDDNNNDDNDDDNNDDNDNDDDDNNDDNDDDDDDDDDNDDNDTGQEGTGGGASGCSFTESALVKVELFSFLF